MRSPFRNAAELMVARVALATLSVGSPRFAARVAGAWVRLWRAIQPRMERIALRNLEMALPEKPMAERRRIMEESFESLARIFVAVARIPRLTRGNVREWIDYDGLEHFTRALEAGRGVLFSTAHLGNWELSAVAHALLTEPMHVVVRPLDNPRLDELVTARRTATGNRVIGKRDYARGILRALQANEAVGILIDQNTAADEGEFVQFFGMAACANASVAKLAARTGAAVIPGFALWDGRAGRYVLKFYPPIDITGPDGTQKLHAHLESVIREHPGQWLWMHRRWKTRPPGEPPLY